MNPNFLLKQSSLSYVKRLDYSFLLTQSSELFSTNDSLESSQINPSKYCLVNTNYQWPKPNSNYLPYCQATQSNPANILLIHTNPANILLIHKKIKTSIEKYYLSKTNSCNFTNQPSISTLINWLIDSWIEPQNISCTNKAKVRVSNDKTSLKISSYYSMNLNKSQ